MGNDFWARKLGNPLQAAQQQTVAPASSAAWWQPPAVQSAPVVASQPQQTSTTSARSAKLEERCPECNSPNYFPLGQQYSSSTGKHESVNRCYDCGFPVRQEFSGAGMPSGQGEVVGKAKQVSTAHSGFHGNIKSSSEAIGVIK